MQSLFLLLALIAFVALFSVPTNAGSVNLKFATSGSWAMNDGSYKVSCTPATFATNNENTCSYYGLPTQDGSPYCCQSQTRWGSTDHGTSDDKSGLGFSGYAANGANEAVVVTDLSRQVVTDSGSNFPVGIVTHYNNPVGEGTAASSGTFKLRLFGILVENTPLADVSFSFPLSIDETFNDPDRYGSRGCPYTTRKKISSHPSVYSYIPGWKDDVTGAEKVPAVNGCTDDGCSCSDRVYFDSTTASTKTGLITISGRSYAIEIVGFSDLATYSASSTAAAFISQENKNTVKFLFGKLTIQCNCPAPLVPTSNDDCTCVCPAGSPKSIADCPNVDYTFNSATCSCTPNNNCNNQQTALLAVALDTNCETLVCAQVGGIYTLSVTALVTGTACRSNPNLCTNKCQTSTQNVLGLTYTRSKCVSVTAPTCNPANACKTNGCNATTGACAPANKPAGTVLTTDCNGSAKAACHTYTCNAAGTCVDTDLSTVCPAGQIADTTPGANCACKCSSTPTCTAAQFFNATSCACENTPCTTKIQDLVTDGHPIDGQCEVVTCQGTTLNFAPRQNGVPCGSSTDRCAGRCQTYTDGLGNPRAKCNDTDVTCNASPTCKNTQCNAANGQCETTNLADGTSCGTTPPPCTTRACQNGACTDTPTTTCQSPQTINATASDCTCKCRSPLKTSQADCAIDFVFDPAACACNPSGNCNQQLAALIGANAQLDPYGCETVTCVASVLTYNKKPAGSTCPGATANLCDFRCQDVNSTRSQCDNTPVICADPSGCVSQQCDPTTGTCQNYNLPTNSLCTPADGIVAGCTVYSCNANNECVGSPTCTIDLPESQLKCRQYSCDNDTQQCVFEPLTPDNCSSSPCSSFSTCRDGECRSVDVECTSQEAVDRGIPGATISPEQCTVRVCNVTDDGSAACVVDYFPDETSTCDKNCTINAHCDGQGKCVGEDDPECNKEKDDHRKEIIGSAAAGGVLSVVGAGAVLVAGAGAGLLVWGVRRRKLLNFETWDSGALDSATVSPLYVPNANEHVNPLAEM